MKQFGIGQPVRRVEDRRFITGHGNYVDDIQLPRQTHAFMLRSPHAHARIGAIDGTVALAAPGVLAVFTGDDLARDGIGPIPCLSAVTNRDGTPSVLPPHPAIARGRVRHVGDTVAMVVAESAAAARDAAELIAVDYEPLPASSKPRTPSTLGSHRCGTKPQAICVSIGRSATAPRSSGQWPGHAIASASTSSTIGSWSIRWSRAAPSANTIRARMPTHCGARPRARISCATCSPTACSKSRRTASGS